MKKTIVLKTKKKPGIDEGIIFNSFVAGLSELENSIPNKNKKTKEVLEYLNFSLNFWLSERLDSKPLRNTVKNSK